MNDVSPARLEFGSALLPPEFWEQVEVQRNGCWHWTGSIDKHGYGRFRAKPVHRLTAAAIREIPHGHVVDHLCHDPRKCDHGRRCPHRRCCNPKHLEPVTPEENTRRGGWDRCRTVQQQVVTTCIRGHLRVPGKGCSECGKLRRAELNRQAAERREAFRNRRQPIW